MEKTAVAGIVPNKTQSSGVIPKSTELYCVEAAKLVKAQGGPATQTIVCSWGGGGVRGRVKEQGREERWK